MIQMKNCSQSENEEQHRGCCHHRNVDTWVGGGVRLWSRDWWHAADLVCFGSEGITTVPVNTGAPDHVTLDSGVALEAATKFGNDIRIVDL